MKKHLLTLSVVLFISFLFDACKPKTVEEPTPVPVPVVKKAVEIATIKATTGGGLETKDGIKMIIPAGTLPKDAEITVGIVGNEPTPKLNTNLSVIGKPFTIKIPVDSLQKNILVELPKPQGYTNLQETSVFIYDGKTYFPLIFKENGNNLEITVDITNWETNYKGNKNARILALGELVVYVLSEKQNPNTEQIGLKEVSLNGNKFTYKDVQSIEANEKVLIMIHGWISDPSTWEPFLPFFKNKSKTGYTKYLTFGYNSSLGINENGLNLSKEIKSKIKGKVDIVAHSMGGLVSRSAIENHECNTFVNNLVTLGTPHLGSPLAALRYYLGYLVAVEDVSNLYINPNFGDFNLTTQGFRDLLPQSNFLTQLNNNPANEVPYFAIAGFGEPCTYQSLNGCFPTGTILEGADDGIVSAASAKFIKNTSQNSTLEVFINSFIAHTNMTSNQDVINAVVGYLDKKYIITTTPTTGLVAYYPFNGDAKDASGNNNHGTQQGGVNFNATDRFGVAGKAAGFDGVNDYVSTIVLQNEVTKYAISFWIKTAKLTGDMTLVNARGPEAAGACCSSSRSISFGIGNGKVVYALNSDFIAVGKNSSNSLVSNEWTHIVGVFSSEARQSVIPAQFKIYVNGNLVSMTDVNYNPNSRNIQSPFTGNGGIKIGAWENQYFFNGSLDDIRIYNRALSDAEVLALYNAEK